MKLRKGYFFGYGADEEEDMIKAITNHAPEIIAKVTLLDYELRVQKLSEITDKGANPREILRKSWGNQFKSYVIIPKKGAKVEGVLFRMSVKDRHLVDKWELVQLSWYRREFVYVYDKSGKRYRAETQVLNDGQRATGKVPGKFRSWLMPKAKFLKIARSSRTKN